MTTYKPLTNDELDLYTGTWLEIARLRDQARRANALAETVQGFIAFHADGSRVSTGGLKFALAHYLGSGSDSEGA